jgi:diazepam-binding inhibitor (GABA receptor modulating acyl-CoA-binding protein)
MPDLTPEFESAVAASETRTTKPDQKTLLRLYALYKQATGGDVTEKRPGFTDRVGRAKWDARNSMKGTGQQQAMSDYIALVESLK